MFTIIKKAFSALLTSYFFGLTVLAPQDVAAADKSVYRLNAAADSVALAVGSLALIVPYTLSSKIIKPRCPCDVNEVNKFDRSTITNANDTLDVISDITQGTTMFLPPVADLIDLGPRKVFVEDLVVFTEAMVINGAVVTAVKHIVQRPLPRTYAGKDEKLINSAGGYRSFYSGHTSATFTALSASAVTGNLRYNLGPWPWVATALIGTSVAFERVAAGRHFYTDVIVGALAGLTLGTVIPLLHRRTDSSAELGSAAFLGAPLELLKLNWKF